MITMSISPKKLFFWIILSLIVTDAIILYNFPIIRPIISFVFFTIVPGFLILNILKIEKLEFAKKITLSIGLSIAFLIFSGLIVNSFYPYILNPLSLNSILISFNLIILFLASIAYLRNKNESIIEISQKGDIFKGKKMSLFIIPTLFPFMAIFGTYIMNNYSNNSLLISMLIIIPIYVAIIYYFKDKVASITYPLAIFSIALSLSLMHSLTSNYLNGRDIYTEYYVYKIAFSQLHWEVNNYPFAYNTCLSITILPVIYSKLLGINGLWVFKVIQPLLISVLPIVCYFIFKKNLDQKYAFLAAFLFISNVAFINDFMSATRTGISVLFFSLAILIFIEDQIEEVSKKFIFIIFVFGLIVSHYSTAYIFLILMGFVWLVSIILKKKILTGNRNIPKIKRSNLTISMIALISVSIFLWYAQLTNVQFEDTTNFIQTTFFNMGNIFLLEMRDQSATAVIGVGVEGSRYLALIIQNIILFFITIGLIYSIRTYKKNKINFNLLILMFASWSLSLSMLVIPYVSKAYGTYRVYLLSLVTLAPLFIIGGVKFFNKFKLKRFTSTILLIIIIMQFFSATGLIDQSLGNPLNEYLNHDGDRYESYYTHDTEIIAAKWLNTYNDKTKINTDYMGYFKLLMDYNDDPTTMRDIVVNRNYFISNQPTKGYVYLSYTNSILGKVYLTKNRDDVSPLKNYLVKFDFKNRIFDDGGAVIYK